MPLIVDIETEKKRIVDAFEHCISAKPLTKITMRDVAAQAGVSYGKVFTYFDSRQDLLLAYINEMLDRYVRFFADWFETNCSGVDFTATLRREYVNRLIKDMVEHSQNKSTSPALQIYILGQYDAQIKTLVERTYQSWREALNILLTKMYGRAMDGSAESLLALLEGALVYSMNVPITADRIPHMLDYLSVL